MSIPILDRIAKTLQVDRSLLYAMAARAWQAVAGPLTIIFIINGLSNVEQGVYYSLASIMGIQLFFELGLLNVVISQSGHLSSQIKDNKPGASQQMGALIRATQTWFLSAGILYALVVISLGWLIMVRKTTTTEWQWPLVWLSLLAASTVVISPKLAILEGAGFRDSIYRMRLVQMISGGLVVWFALLSGLKLWALVLSTGVQLVCALAITAWQHRDFFQTTGTQDRIEHSAGQYSSWAWFQDVFPVQWRVALSSVLYHIATQFFTVIVLWYHGEAEAGRLGMTLTITAAIQGMSLTWIQTKYPVISALHGSGDREGAGTMWRHSAIVSSGLLLAAMSVAISVVWLLPWAGRGWESRLIAPWQMAILALGCLANHAIAIQGFYVLARKGRPFLVACVIGFCSTALSVYFGGRAFGTTGIVIGYAAAMTLITLPLHTMSYVTYRNK